MGDKKAEEQLKSENGAIFNNKEKISNVLKTAVKEKLASMDCLIGKCCTARFCRHGSKRLVFGVFSISILITLISNLLS